MRAPRAAREAMEIASPVCGVREMAGLHTPEATESRGRGEVSGHARSNRRPDGQFLPKPVQRHLLRAVPGSDQGASEAQPGNPPSRGGGRRRLAVADPLFPQRAAHRGAGRQRPGEPLSPGRLALARPHCQRQRDPRIARRRTGPRASLPRGGRPARGRGDLPRGHALGRPGPPTRRPRDGRVAEAQLLNHL